MIKYKIIFTDSYTKRAIKFLRKRKNLVTQYEKTLKLLEINPFHQSLRLHKINSQKDVNLFSISINLSYRITINFLISWNEIIPINIWSHDEVY